MTTESLDGMCLMLTDDVLTLIESQLTTAVAEMDEADMVEVTRPSSLEGYKLNHAKGALLILHQNSEYGEERIQNEVVMNRIMNVTVYALIRSGKSGMLPHEYIDFITSTLGGMVINNQFSTGIVTPRSDEFVFEEQGVWCYGVTLTVPVEYVKMIDQING